MIPTHCIICLNKLEFNICDMYYCGLEYPKHEFWINPYKNNPNEIRQIQLKNDEVNICWHYDYKYISLSGSRTKIWFEPDLSDYPKLMNKIRKLLIFL